MPQIYKPTFFINDATQLTRQAEVPDALFNSGMGSGGSNSPGIGINIDGGAIVDEPQQFTVLDQFGNARQAQIGQNIGGNGYTDPAGWPGSGGLEGTAPDATIRVVADSSAIPADGSLTLPAEGAWLTDAPTGWVEDPTP